MKLLHNKVIKNASWIVGAQIFKAIFGLLISFLTARYLGPSNYGVINYAASIVAFVAPIMYLGFNNTLVQEIVSHPHEEGRVMGSAIMLSFISGVFCVGGTVSFALIANKDEKTTIIVCSLYSLILIFQSFDLINYWFQAKLLSKYSSIVSLVAYIIVSGYRILLLIAGKSVVWFSVASAFDVLLISGGLLFLYRKISHEKLAFSFSFALQMLSRSKYYILSNLMIAIFAQTDKIMLKLFDDSTAVGIYTSAYTIAGLIGIVFCAIIDSMRPIVLGQKQRNEPNYENGIIALYSIIIYLSLAYGLMVTVLAPFLITIMYGTEYAGSIPVLRIIVWYGTSSYLGGARDIWILAEQKQKYLLPINVLGAVSNIALNTVLIPKYSAIGAAVATVLTQFAINIIFVSIYKPTKRNGYLMLKALNPKNILNMKYE